MCDLISQYALKSKDNTSINFMCLAMNEPVTSWFKIIQLPIVTKLTVPKWARRVKR